MNGEDEDGHDNNHRDKNTSRRAGMRGVRH